MMARQRGESIDSVALMTALALECLGVPQVVKACSPDRGEAFDPQAWITTGGTLHLLAAEGEATNVAPLIVALVDEVVAAAGLLASHRDRVNGHKLTDPLVRLVLDELPALCPLSRLSSHLSDGGGRGIQVVWFARARGQLVDRFGRERAAAIISATSTMLYGGGLNDPDLLKDISTMLGHVVVRQGTRMTDRLGFRTFGEMYRQAAVLEPSEIYRLPPFEAVMLVGGSGGALVRMVPWWKRADAQLVRQSITEAKDRFRSVG
jgi:type IV secretory pathway TraG/TraD family ATPase VirD4